MKLLFRGLPTGQGPAPTLKVITRGRTLERRSGSPPVRASLPELARKDISGPIRPPGGSGS
jgi:hypothetical protein